MVESNSLVETNFHGGPQDNTSSRSETGESVSTDSSSLESTDQVQILHSVLVLLGMERLLTV